MHDRLKSSAYRRHRLSKVAAAPGASSAEMATPAEQRQLATYLPPKVVAAFREAGVTHDLYPWQARAHIKRLHSSPQSQRCHPLPGIPAEVGVLPGTNGGMHVCTHL